MTICHVQGSGTIELYFYGELGPPARDEVDQHLRACADCRQALEDLQTIRFALAHRPDVSTPPGGDWTGFMTRLDEAIRREVVAEATPVLFGSSGSTLTGRYVAYFAMAALLALVTASVAYLARARQGPHDTAMASSEASTQVDRLTPASVVAGQDLSADAAFASLSEQHFERSKLVVLGLANKDPRQSSADDWAYERQLASTLLSDTRLYRLAAEERGLRSVARVMGDLELVLLQTALSSDPEPATLDQIQRLIRKRNLVTKMNVGAAGY